MQSSTDASRYQQTDILRAVEAFVAHHYANKVDKRYVYHDFQHTCSVVQAAQQIGDGYELSDGELHTLLIAAWFHDIGYDQGPEEHEARSCRYAQEFLEAYQLPSEELERIQECIMATRMPQKPSSLLAEILCDADFAHLGNDQYWDRCSRVRQEMALVQNVLLSDLEWVEFELDFMTRHRYHTDVARDIYEAQKARHIRQLTKQRQRLKPARSPEDLAGLRVEQDRHKKKKKKNHKLTRSDFDLKQVSLGRGVETMYRTAYRTHVNLSSIADNKANIMLSVNAIIISIVVANLVPKLTYEPHLLIPTLILLGVCLTALVFAILATRPKVTEGRFTRGDIESKQANLLFFGNFYNMDLDDFHWGMMEMIKDSDFLYSSMTRDLYFLGIVLAKKYRYLSICYAVFMYGLILAVAAFALAYLGFAGLGG